MAPWSFSFHLGFHACQFWWFAEVIKHKWRQIGAHVDIEWEYGDKRIAGSEQTSWSAKHPRVRGLKDWQQTVLATFLFFWPISLYFFAAENYLDMVSPTKILLRNIFPDKEVPSWGHSFEPKFKKSFKILLVTCDKFRENLHKIDPFARFQVTFSVFQFFVCYYVYQFFCFPYTAANGNSEIPRFWKKNGQSFNNPKYKVLTSCLILSF